VSEPSEADLDAIFGDLERQKAFQAAETSNNFADLPPGSYQARIDRVEIKPSRNGIWQLVWTFIVLAPSQYRNRRLWLHQDLEDLSRQKYLKAALQGAGVEWYNDFSAIRDRRAELLDRIVELRLTQGGPKQDGTGFFVNTYVNRFLGMYNSENAPATAEAVPAPKDDEIPF
jgi:hypothetical protein